MTIEHLFPANLSILSLIFDGPNLSFFTLWLSTQQNSVTEDTDVQEIKATKEHERNDKIDDKGTIERDD